MAFLCRKFVFFANIYSFVLTFKFCFAKRQKLYNNLLGTMIEGFDAHRLNNRKIIIVCRQLKKRK